jgi:hypothetical protein
MNWIELEFRRTRLPRSALARYLERQKPVVSLIASGDRKVSSEEADLIRAFFSVVPPDANAEFLAAVETLNSKKLRTRIGIELYRHFVREADQAGRGFASSIAELLEPLTEKQSILRADQIISISRIARLDLGDVTGGPKVGDISVKHRRQFDDALSELSSAAKKWMSDSKSPRAYEFDRGGRFEPIYGGGGAIAKVELQAVANNVSEFSECAGFMVADGNAKPFFEKGQTIFLSRTKPRRGDLVAVILNEARTSQTTAVIGKLAYDNVDAVVLDRSDGPQKLEKKLNLDVRRIDFCRL